MYEIWTGGEAGWIGVFGVVDLFRSILIRDIGALERTRNGI